MRLPLNIRFTLLFILPLFVAVYFLVNGIASKNFSSKEVEIKYWKNKKNLYRASLASFDVLREHPENIHAHYQFLENYCLLKKRDRDLISDDVQEVFGDLEDYYHDLLVKDPTNPIGFYGFWKLKSYLDIEDKKIAEFDKADSINLKSIYINELRGDIFHNYNHGNLYYNKEIELYPSNKTAKIKLVRRLLKTDSKELKALLNDPSVLTESSLYTNIRYYYFKHDFFKWLSLISKQVFLYDNIFVILNALFIGLIWIVFLFYIDVFKDINKRELLICVVLTFIFIPFIVTVLYDGYYFTRDTNFEEGIFWSNFIVGLFEEITKIIFPLLIVFLFDYRFRSPFSVMIVFVSSALIFATIENMLYLGQYFDISITSTRAVYAILGHMTYIAIAAYGYVLYKFKNKSILVFLLTFSLAILSHMFYDIIINSIVHYLIIPFEIISAFILFSIFNNLLNNSPNFNHEKENRLNKSGLFLISGLSLVMLMEFISVSLDYGTRIGNAVLLDSTLNYGWLILVFASPLSNFKLVKDKWAFIDFGGLKTFDSHSNDILEIEVKPISSNASAYRLKIIGTVRANSEKKWFHCVQENTQEYYLLSFNEDGDHLIDKNIMLFVLQAEKEVSHAFNPKSYKYLGLVLSSPVIND